VNPGGAGGQLSSQRGHKYGDISVSARSITKRDMFSTHLLE